MFYSGLWSQHKLLGRSKGFETSLVSDHFLEKRERKNMTTRAQFPCFSLVQWF